MKMNFIICSVVLLSIFNFQDNEIDIIIDKIENHNVLESKNSGFGNNILSEQYKRYIILKTDVSTDKLTDVLFKTKNAVVKIYCYYALLERKNIDLKKIKEFLSNDSSKFIYLDGCIGATNKLNDFISNENNLYSFN